MGRAAARRLVFPGPQATHCNNLPRFLRFLRARLRPLSAIFLFPIPCVSSVSVRQGEGPPLGKASGKASPQEESLGKTSLGKEGPRVPCYAKWIRFFRIARRQSDKF